MRFRSLRQVLAASSLAVAPIQTLLADDWKLIHAGHLLDQPGEPMRQRATIIVRDDRIESVANGFLSREQVQAIAEEDTVETVDLRDRYVLPGLIDCHSHLLVQVGPATQLEQVQRSDADYLIDGVVNARLTLEAGFTTIRDPSDIVTVRTLRDAVADGRIVGPRMVVSGSMISPPGGHGDVGGYREELFRYPAHDALCSGVEDCRRAVRLQVKHGDDLIKVAATGGVLSNIGGGTDRAFFDEELRAIVETSHMLGKKVAAHAHGKAGVDAALRAGADSIEHGTFLDQESVKLFRKTGAYLVPTMLAADTLARAAQSPDSFPPLIRQKALAVTPYLQDAVALAYKGGVKIAFGTDAGVARHGDNAKEFALLVKAGMAPAEAIKAATIHAADLLGMSNDIGTISAGKFADMIAMSGNPITQIRALEHVEWVMKGGKVVKHESKP